MPKYAGIPVELEASVEAAIVAAMTSAEVNRSKSTLETEVVSLKQQLDAAAVASKAKHDEIEALKVAASALEKDKASLTTKVSEQTVELGTVRAELSTLQEAAATLTAKAKSDEVWTKVKAQYGLDESQRAAKQPLIDKIVAGKEGLNVDEILELSAGGKGQKATATAPMLRVVAGAADPNQVKADPDVVRKNFPMLQTLSISSSRKSAGG